MSVSTSDLLSTAPYVGPRSFTAQETLYGREREAQELRALLISERIVLLYSPSGAGKTSLLNAKVIPELERRQFAVQPVLRVSLGAPEGAGNRYLNSLALSLQPHEPGGATPAGLAPGSSLAELLDARPSAANPGGEVLIFDQFEEILTLDPTDIAAKEQFFREVGAALRRPSRWALFSMREDYVAALDPYLRYLPTRLSCTFRLDLLGVEAAGEAITRPAREQRGVTVAPEVVQSLVRNLSLVQVQRADGSTAQEPGPYVEPVQLQVVCLRMWDEWLRRRAPEALTIGAADVDVVDSVGDALRDYYEQRVREVAADADAQGARGSERAIREWFDRHLITPTGIRGQVLRGHERTEGLANTAIRQLVDAYLVRSERRGGRTWYELAHDRLIGPVQESNAEWRRDNLAPAQVQAALWEAQRQPDELVLRGEKLREAEAWAVRPGAIVNDVEEQFLQRCREVAEAEERDRARTRLIRNLGLGAIALGLVASIAAGVAVRQRSAALLARDQAQARQLAAESQRTLAVEPQHALLLAVESATIPGREPLPDALTTLYGALAATGGRALPGELGQLSLLEISPDGRYLAAAGDATEIYLWDRSAPDAAPTPLRGHQGPILALRFSPDSATLASSAEDGTLLVRRLDDPGAPATLLGETASFSDLRFSPDGATLAAAEGSVVRLWQTADLAAAPATLEGHAEVINALAFSPDGRRLATASSDTTVRIWDQARRAELAALAGGEDTLTLVAFSPDGRRVAAAGASGAARLWELGGPAPEARLLAGGREEVSAMAFAPDGRLALAGDDGAVRLWPPDGAGEPVTLDLQNQPLRALAFDPAGRTLVTASEGGGVVLWSAEGSGIRPQARAGHTGPANAVAFAPDGARFYTAGVDGRVREWEPSALGPVPALRGAGGGILALAPDGAGGLIATAADGGVARWGQAGDGYAAAELRAAGDELMAAAAGGDGGPLALATSAATIELWAAGSAGGPARTLDAGGPVQLLAVSRDGRRLAAAREDGATLLWELDGAAEATTLPQDGRYPTALAVSDDGAWLAVAYDDTSVELTDLAGATTRRLAGHQGAVGALAFSHDGALLATGSDDRSVRLWPVRGEGAPRAVLRGHTDGLAALAFSPDDATLASASYDRSVRLWQVASPAAPPIVLQGHAGSAAALAFSPEGATLATGGGDRAIRLWPLGTAELTARACATAGRNLSIDEWEQSLESNPYRKTCAALPVSASLVEAAIGAARQGEGARAEALATQLLELGAAGEVPARRWVSLCRFQALAAADGAARWCDQALANDPADGLAYDRRALARARAGNRAGALEDLRRYLAWAPGAGEPEERVAQREAWAAALEAGDDPYDAAALEELAAEEEQ